MTRPVAASGKGGEFLTEDGRQWRKGSGAARKRRYEPRTLGDSMCKSCPKWDADTGESLEIGVDEARDLRTAVLAIKLGRLPSELDEEPWDAMRRPLPIIEELLAQGMGR